MVRYGRFDLAQPEILMLIEIPRDTAQSEPQAVISPQRIMLMAPCFRLRAAGNGRIGQRLAFSRRGIIDIHGKTAAVLPRKKGLRRGADDIPGAIKMHDLAADADPGVFRQAPGQIAVNHRSW